MPRKQIDYSNTKIYKLVCKDLNVKFIYVGYTTDWIVRKYKHKYESNSNIKNFKVYTMIRENGGWENWDMILIEEFPCENSLQARQRERHWYETLNSTLNTHNPYRNDTNEWFEENRETKSKKFKQYYEENKEELKDRHKKYYEENKEEINRKCECECGSSYNKQGKARHLKTKKHINFFK